MIKNPQLIWPEQLVLRDTTIYADEGQRIFTTATGYGYEKQKYIRADVAGIGADEKAARMCAICGGPLRAARENLND